MAFYTSRVDSDGNELERRIDSSRSLADSQSSMNNIISHTSRLSLSSRSCSTKSSSIRYINSATYIEKFDNANTDNESMELPSSSCMSETQSDIVPPLDMPESEENYPTTRRDYTFSYHKHTEAAKIISQPDEAYKTWLSAKKKVLSDEAARRKKQEQDKIKEVEERKRLAKENFELWLEKKKTNVQKSSTSIVTTSTAMTSNDPRSIANEMQQYKSQLSESEIRARLEKWERAKTLEEERRRTEKRQQEQKRVELEKQRRRMATEAWNKWLADSSKKPKPVPLNRGIYTLSGTVSDIFVNPNEWQPLTAGMETQGRIVDQ